MSQRLPKSHRSKASQALWSAITGACLFLLWWFLVKFETEIRAFSPGCYFHQFTGLHCPGCGMTRAVYATLHGDFGQAFRMNPMGMVLLPLGMIWLAVEWFGWLRGRPLKFRPNPGAKTFWAIGGLVLAFWVLRNIPVWPFTLLAPR